MVFFGNRTRARVDHQRQLRISAARLALPAPGGFLNNF